MVMRYELLRGRPQFATPDTRYWAMPADERLRAVMNQVRIDIPPHFKLGDSGKLKGRIKDWLEWPEAYKLGEEETKRRQQRIAEEVSALLPRTDRLAWLDLESDYPSLTIDGNVPANMRKADFILSFFDAGNPGLLAKLTSRDFDAFMNWAASDRLPYCLTSENEMERAYTNKIPLGQTTHQSAAREEVYDYLREVGSRTGIRRRTARFNMKQLEKRLYQKYPRG